MKVGAPPGPGGRALTGLGASRSPTQGANQPGFRHCCRQGGRELQVGSRQHGRSGYRSTVAWKTTTASPATRTRSPASHSRRLGRPIATPWSIVSRAAPVRALA
jgi:hypothetical protein